MGGGFFLTRMLVRVGAWRDSKAGKRPDQRAIPDGSDGVEKLVNLAEECGELAEFIVGQYSHAERKRPGQTRPLATTVASRVYFLLPVSVSSIVISIFILARSAVISSLTMARGTSFDIQALTSAVMAMPLAMPVIL